MVLLYEVLKLQNILHQHQEKNQEDGLEKITFKKDGVKDNEEVSIPSTFTSAVNIPAPVVAATNDSDSEKSDENIKVDTLFNDIEMDVLGIVNDGAISVGDILDTGVCRDIDVQGMP